VILDSGLEGRFINTKPLVIIFGVLTAYVSKLSFSTYGTVRCM